jgi:hypothetical protein
MGGRDTPPAMRAIIFALLAVGAFAQNTAESRQWQQGTVQSLQLEHRGLFDPHSAEIDLEIVGTDNVLYKTTLAYEIHKVDMIPGAGIVTEERRRKKTHLNVAVGSIVKYQRRFQTLPNRATRSR